MLEDLLSACARAPLLPAMNRDSANHDLADRALQLKREPFNLPSYRSRSIIRHCDLSATPHQITVSNNRVCAALFEPRQRGAPLIRLERPRAREQNGTRRGWPSLSHVPRRSAGAAFGPSNSEFVRRGNVTRDVTPPPCWTRLIYVQLGRSNCP